VGGHWGGDCAIIGGESGELGGSWDGGGERTVTSSGKGRNINNSSGESNQSGGAGFNGVGGQINNSLGEHGGAVIFNLGDSVGFGDGAGGSDCGSILLCCGDGSSGGGDRGYSNGLGSCLLRSWLRAGQPRISDAIHIWAILLQALLELRNEFPVVKIAVTCNIDSRTRKVVCV